MSNYNEGAVPKWELKAKMGLDRCTTSRYSLEGSKNLVYTLD